MAARTNDPTPVNSTSGTKPKKKQSISYQSSMDILEKACKKSVKCSVKVGKIMFKTLLKPVVRTMSQIVTETCLQPLAGRRKPKQLAFMSVIVKVDYSMNRWHKGVLAIQKSIKGARGKMEQEGVFQISGLADPDRLLKKIGRSSHVTLLGWQFGQCSENLFMASISKKSEPPAPAPPPAKETQRIGYGNYYNYDNNTRFPFLPPSMDAGFPYPSPHLITPYGPYY